MRGWVSLLGAVLALAGSASLGRAQPPPVWFAAEVEASTRDGGRWRATAPDEAPFDAFVIEWTRSRYATGMTGRLSGWKKGREVAEFWQFRQFWHPGDRKALVFQWGLGGAFGAGEQVSLGGGRTKLTQDLAMADGTTRKSGHIAYFKAPDEHVTEQYAIAADGVWTLENRLVWRRETSAQR
jgi:hypothetical protein